MKIFPILLIVVSTFIFNIWLYYTSENYRIFLQNIKQENVIEKVNDDYKPLEEKLTISEKLFEENLWKSILQSEVKKIKVDNNNVEDIILTNYFKKFLKNFEKYNLVNLKSNYSLMGVTTEYPDDYFHYYSPELSIFLFTTKTYNEVKEIFEIESDWNFFSINEVNNFWEKSFFINLWKDFDDWFIRFIFLKEDNIIWIKVLETEYNNIKNIIK